MNIRTKWCFRILLCLPGFFMADIVYANSIDELNSLAQATENPGSGIALARQQTAQGQLLDALATLERVLINFPQSDEARLLHAGMLCRLDDRMGSLAEFDALRGHDFAPDLWNEATAPCTAAKTGN